jgi:hypothetical protein
VLRFATNRKAVEDGGKVDQNHLVVFGFGGCDGAHGRNDGRWEILESIFPGADEVKGMAPAVSGSAPAGPTGGRSRRVPARMAPLSTAIR